MKNKGALSLSITNNLGTNMYLQDTMHPFFTLYVIIITVYHILCNHNHTEMMWVELQVVVLGFLSYLTSVCSLAVKKMASLLYLLVILAIKGE